MASDRLQENALKLHQGGLNWILEKKKNTERVVFGLEQAAQGSGGVPIPGGI